MISLPLMLASMPLVNGCAHARRGDQLVVDDDRLEQVAAGDLALLRDLGGDVLEVGARRRSCSVSDDDRLTVLVGRRLTRSRSGCRRRSRRLDVGMWNRYQTIRPPAVVTSGQPTVMSQLTAASPCGTASHTVPGGCVLGGRCRSFSTWFFCGSMRERMPPRVHQVVRLRVEERPPGGCLAGLDQRLGRGQHLVERARLGLVGGHPRHRRQEVVEVEALQLPGHQQVCDRVWILHARDRDVDRVVGRRGADLGLQDAARVDAAAHDVGCVGEILGGDAVAVDRPRLQDDLEASAQVEAEGEPAHDDGRGGGHHQRDHHHQDREVAALLAQGFGSLDKAVMGNG